MIIDKWIIINVIILVLQFGISMTKYKYLGLAMVIVSCVSFMISKEEQLYNLALFQFIIFFITFEISKLYEIVLKKKRNNDVDKSKIKDL